MSYLERLRSAAKIGEQENIIKDRERELKKQKEFDIDTQYFNDTVDANIDKIEQCFASGKEKCGFWISFPDRPQLDKCTRAREILGMPFSKVENYRDSFKTYNAADYSDMKPRKGYFGLNYLPNHKEECHNLKGFCFVEVQLPPPKLSDLFKKKN